MNEKHIGWQNCPNCGKEFEITTSTTSKIYCRDKCKHEINKERDRELNRLRWRKNHPKVET